MNYKNVVNLQIKLTFKLIEGFLLRQNFRVRVCRLLNLWPKKGWEKTFLFSFAAGNRQSSDWYKPFSTR